MGRVWGGNNRAKLCFATWGSRVMPGKALNYDTLNLSHGVTFEDNVSYLSLYV